MYKSGGRPVKYYYRVTQQVSALGWVDLNLFGLERVRQFPIWHDVWNFQVNVNIVNPNQGPWTAGSPCSVHVVVHPSFSQVSFKCLNQRLKFAQGGRGEANLVSKCKLCSRENSIDLVADSVASYDAADPNSWKTVVVMDCRGMEPVEFSPRNG